MIANRLRPEELRLIRIAVPSPTGGGGTAGRMVDDGWTVEKVATAKIEELYKYSFHDEISKIWKVLASKFVAENCDCE